MKSRKKQNNSEKLVAIMPLGMIFGTLIGIVAEWDVKKSLL